ncbi:MAG: endonuclease/exonuclease/phosphatase family protein [Chloroflexota bacterium]|nr:endonuclease/exonuclease/phosphatase family protein [Chloroflexota bacterium]
MKILNWNTEWLGPRSRKGRFAKAKALIATYDPDIICLTEAHPETMPDGGHAITSGLSGAGNMEKRGRRKVVLWSRFGWMDVDALGSDKLPEGRYVSAKTACGGIEFHFVGMCVPYHGYRNSKRWGESRKRNWQGACEYLDALRQDILTRRQFKSRAILLGDFNLQIPPHNYPYRRSEVNRKRQATFDGWSIPTAGEWDEAALDKRFIDHIAHTPDLGLRSLRFFSRIAADGSRLSDHNGVCIEITTN